jgi:ABC-2 type transport system ATP-binding protein
MNKPIETKRIYIFLALAFGISWSIALYLFINGGLADSPILIEGTGITVALALIALGYMWAPAIANILTRAITKEGSKDTWLPLSFSGNRRFWALAWLLPAGLTLLGGALYYAFFPQHFDATLSSLSGLIQNAASQSGQALPFSIGTIALLQILQGVLLAPLINSFFTFGEEYGWRAYLQPKLMPLGYRKGLLLTGAIWGIWHVPIIAMGHNYGLDYPGYPWAGILAMTWFTMSVGVVFGWLTIQGKSVWPAVIGHAALNGIAGAAALFLAPNSGANLLVGPLPIGIIGGLPWLVLALWLLWKGEPITADVSRETSAKSPSTPLPKGSMIFAEGLSKSFGTVRAVSSLDLNIPAGEVFGLLGPNGAGKTTTIRMLAALISPSSGEAYVSGYRLGEQNHEIRKSVGILTEAPGLYAQISAQRNLEFYAQMYEVQDISGQVERYLRMLGLWERRKDQAGTFSKGMRQKLAIARSLLHEPKVLYLDEPTSGLDPEAAKLVREFIDELRGQGRTIILTTHNLDEADRLCDRIAIFNSRLLALDSPANLRLKLYGREVIFELSKIKASFAKALRQNSYVKVAESKDNDLRVTLDDPAKRNPELIRQLLDLGAEIQFVRESQQSLEDVYLDLVQNGNQDEELNS